MSASNAALIPLWTMVPGGAAPVSWPTRSTNALDASEPSTMATPGLVQNWPDPRVIDATRPAAISSPRAFIAEGRTNGFAEPSSP